jgi:hypothetical protein
MVSVGTVCVLLSLKQFKASATSPCAVCRLTLMLFWLNTTTLSAVSIRVNESSPKFLIEITKGDVQEKLPASGAWQKVVHLSEVEEDTLIKVGKDSIATVRVTYPPESTGSPKEFRYQLRQPTILRINRDLIRKRSFFEGELTIPDDQSKQTGGAVDLTLGGSLHEAWDRLMSLSLISDTFSLQKGEKKSDLSELLKVIKISDKIKITSPRPGEIFKPHQVPFDLDVNWEISANYDAKKLLMVLQKVGEKPVEINLADSDRSWSVALNEIGEYKIQIVSPDRKVTSADINFVVLDQVSKAFNLKQDDLKPIEVILLGPEKNFQIFTNDRRPFSMEFCWSILNASLHSSVSSILMVRDEKGLSVANIKTSENCAEAKLLGGSSYKWFVRVFAEKSTANGQTYERIGESKHRALLIQKSRNPIADFNAKFDHFLSGDKSATLVIE